MSTQVNERKDSQKTAGPAANPGQKREEVPPTSNIDQVLKIIRDRTELILDKVRQYVH